MTLLSRSVLPHAALMAALVASTSALAAPPAQGQAVGGEGFAPGSAVVAVVMVPRPWYAPRSLVAARMRDTVAEYEALPGLAFKAYSFARADGAFGGLYLWKDLASARAQFNTAWFERVERERGVKGQVRLFEVPVAIDNTPGGTPRNLHSTAIGTVVSLPVPAGVGREKLVQEFQAAIPSYRQIPGLLIKAFTLSDDGRFGGVSLWQDAASAERWFNAGWQQRVRDRYGAEAQIEWFETPILLPSRLAANQPGVAGWVAAH